MRETELKVYYGGGKIRLDVDDSIEEALKPFGFKRWASGCNLEDGVRDLAFESAERVKANKESNRDTV